MSKGISWRQRLMLQSLLQLEKSRTPRRSSTPYPVAWRELDYGPTGGDKDTPEDEWNIEQATRRALRSLEKRGLVTLGRYSFWDHAEPYSIVGLPMARIEWHCQHPDRHVSGQSRFMTGVLLTELGRKVAQREKSNTREG